MPQLMSSPSSSNANNSPFGNPLDLLKVIADLANNNQQNQDQSSSLDAQGKTQQTQNAYQKGVNKALSEHGYKHGTDALASGVDPNEIANHEAMQPPGTPAGDIRTLTINGQSQEPDPSQVLTNLINSNQQQSLNPIQQQALNIINPQGVHPLGMLLNLIGNVTGMGAANQSMNTAKLQNLATAQKVIAGQPSEIAVPEAQAAEINQKIQGAVPLQPADIVKLNIDSYSAALKANQDAYANSNAEVANLTKTLDILQQGRSSFGKAFGGSSDIMNSLKQVIAAKTAANQKISKNQDILMKNAPKVTANVDNKNSGFKVIGVR